MRQSKIFEWARIMLSIREMNAHPTNIHMIASIMQEPW